MEPKTVAIVCECNGTGFFPQEFSNGATEVECPTHNPAYQEAPSVDELIAHLSGVTGFRL